MIMYKTHICARTHKMKFKCFKLIITIVTYFKNLKYEKVLKKK